MRIQDNVINKVPGSASEEETQPLIDPVWFDRSAWRFILRTGVQDRILCLDTFAGRTAYMFSPICRQISVIHFDPVVLREIQQRLDRKNVPNAEYALIAQETGSLPFPDNHFDVFAFHGMNATWSSFGVEPDQGRTTLEKMLAEVHRVLKKDGFVYIGLQNTYGYDKWFNAFQKGKSSPDRQQRHIRVNSKTFQTLMSRAGFEIIEMYPMILDHDQVQEIVMGRGYHSVKNSFSFKERIKQIILSGWWINFFSPGWGTVSWKGSPGRKFLEDLLLDLKNNALIVDSKNDPIGIKRYIVVNGKVFLSIGRPDRLYGEKMIILPLDSASLSRRWDEAEILNELRGAGLPISSMIPKFHGEGCLHGQRYFVISEIEGITIDREFPQLESITRRAVSSLIEFHAGTARDCMVGDDEFSTLFSVQFDRVIQKLGVDSEPRIKRIEAILRDRMRNRRMKTVWMHGDFKIENILFDPSNYEVRGIIDWDLSRKVGLPLLDLLYLLTYNRVIREKRTVENIFLENILPLKLLDFETDLLNKYTQALDIPREQMLPLLVMYWIHHVAYRMYFNPSSEGEEQKIFSVFDSAIAHLSFSRSSGAVQ